MELKGSLYNYKDLSSFEELKVVSGDSRDWFEDRYLMTVQYNYGFEGFKKLREFIDKEEERFNRVWAGEN